MNAYDWPDLDEQRLSGEDALLLFDDRMVDVGVACPSRLRQGKPDAALEGKEPVQEVVGEHDIVVEKHDIIVLRQVFARDEVVEELEFGRLLDDLARPSRRRPSRSVDRPRARSIAA